MYIKRQKALLSYLYLQNTWVTSGELAKHLHVTTRTVRNDVGVINAIRPPLIASGEKGYRIADGAQLPPDVDSAPMEPKERGDFLLVKLLTSCDPLDLNDLADGLHVSYQTICKDFRCLQSNWQSQEVRLIRSSDLVRIEAPEHSRRKLLSTLIHDELDDNFHDITAFHHQDAYFDFAEIRNLLGEVFTANQVFITQYNLHSVALHLAIALKRIQSHQWVDGTEYDTPSLDGCREFELAQQIAQSFSQRHGFAIPLPEVSSVAYQLLGRLENESLNGMQQTMDADILALGQRLIDGIESAYGLTMHTENTFFLFVSHLQNMLIRLRNNKKSRNPMAKNFKNTYPVIYDMAVFMADCLHREIGVEIVEDELTSLAIHIGTALEHMRLQAQEEGKLRSILVCPQYPQQGDTLSQAISKAVGGDLVWKGIYHSILPTYAHLPVDLIFTTSNLASSTIGNGQQVIFIHPFLRSDDFTRIEQGVRQAQKRRDQAAFSCRAQQWFHEELFLFNPPCQNEWDCISTICERMTQQAIVDAGFCELVCKREHLSSTTYGGGFAIPHSMEMNTKKTAFGVLVFPKPIPWGDDRVQLVLLPAICHEDNKEFLTFYETLSQQLLDEQVQKSLCRAENFSDFLHRLQTIF